MLDSLPVVLMVGTVMGFLAGLGIGGGSLLILWLTMVIGMEQSAARSINLLFFLPAALIACLFRWKQGNVKWKQLWPAVLSGCIAAGIFSFVGTVLDMELLKKIFGCLLIITGIRELLYKKKSGT